MKQKLLKFVFAMLLGGLFTTAKAQKTMDVSSFTREDNDLTAKISKPVRDKDEGKLCALIRVESGLKDLNVRADAYGYVQKEEHNGEVWLYVPYGAKGISFSHEGYFSLVYQYEIPIEEGVVYKLRIQSYDTPPAQGIQSQTQMFVLNHYPDDATVIIDGVEQPTENGIYAAMMSKGKHSYRVQASQYEEKDGEFVVGNEIVRETVNLEPLFGTFQLNTLPEDGFDVFIDSQFVGSSPYKSEPLQPGRHIVHIQKAKYYPVDTIVYLRKSDNLDYRIKLTSYEDSLFYKRILGGHNVSFGVNAGYLFPFVSSSSGGGYTGSPINYSLGDSRENVSYSSQSGFTAGVFADIRLYRNLYLITGLNYTYIKYANNFSQIIGDAIVDADEEYVYKGNVNANYDEKYTLNLFEIPILASYRFVITRNSSLHVNVGPYFNYGLSAKMKVSGSSETDGNVYGRWGLVVDSTPLDIFYANNHMDTEFDLYSKVFDFIRTYEYEGGSSRDAHEKYLRDSSPYNRFNYGLKAGITYELRGFQLGIGYNIQLSNMGNADFWETPRIPIINGQVGTNNMTGYKHRIHSFEIKLGYVFRY